jgi:hypothetical protein
MNPTETHPTQPASARRVATALMLLAAGLTVVLRLVPHPANLLPVGAMGIFGGAKLRGWAAYLWPIGAMVASDVALWVYSGFNDLYLFEASRLYVYASFLIYVGIGRLLRDRESPLVLGGASLLGSLQFFVVTNFFVWLLQPLQSAEHVPEAFRYSRDLAGLLNCFVAALPFFQGQSPLELHAILVGHPQYGVFGLVIGDLLFTTLLFGLNAALVPKAVPGPTAVPAPSVQATQG